MILNFMLAGSASTNPFLLLLGILRRARRRFAAHLTGFCAWWRTKSTHKP